MHEAVTTNSHTITLAQADDTPTLELARFEPLLDTHRAAALLGIHPKTLQKLARAGTVPGHRIGDLWRFRASELDMWLRTGINSKPPLVP